VGDIMESKYALEDIFILFSYIFATFVIGCIFFIVSLLISYLMATAFLSLNLIPADSWFYSISVAYLDAIRDIMGAISGFIF
jgi:hypothetical protein